MSAANLKGQRFGRLLVTARLYSGKSGTVWYCECDCGGSAFRRTQVLTRTQMNGCDWCQTERRSAVRRVHGEALSADLGGKTKLYMVWKGMHSRCRDPGHGSFKYYGGKGIQVCGEWGAYPVFRAWAVAQGYRQGLTIDRVDSDGDYEPANCEWVTRGENTRRAAAHRRRNKK